MNNKDKIKIFISYSHKDSKMRKTLQTHLDNLARVYNIDTWYDGKIPAGGNIDETIAEEINNSDIIILLISADYLSSYYCYDKELKTAMERHNRNECLVIPVILHDFVRDNYPFAGLKYVPTDGKPIDNFRPANKGYVDATTGIRNLIKQFSETNKVKQNEVIKKRPKPTRSKKDKGSNSPKAEKSNSYKKTTNSKVCYSLIKNGKKTSFDLNQKQFDCFTSFVHEIPKFMDDADLLLQNQISDLKKQIVPKATVPTVLKRGKEDSNIFFAQLFTYIQKHFVGVDDTYVHFRIRNKNHYITLSEFGYPIEGLTAKPIPAFNSIIGLSVTEGVPIIQSLNNRLHRETHPEEEIKRNYITFTFNTISMFYNVDISMCISVVGTNKNKCNDIFVAMAVMRFDKIIEDYIIKYIDSCRKLHREYKIDKVLKYGG